ncbi:hypothetical protein E2C01_079766 [Portunus trituberculatus]|uniref:Uncharacterized protein n=1 Tax=Portunus trituberculatus TaxID=210409 RepID=A0A5B7IWH4_PORTR|nr:hypothetical protein [Portunus trituberculatus]
MWSHLSLIVSPYVHVRVSVIPIEQLVTVPARCCSHKHGSAPPPQCLRFHSVVLEQNLDIIQQLLCWKVPHKRLAWCGRTKAPTRPRLLPPTHILAQTVVPVSQDYLSPPPVA